MIAFGQGDSIMYGDKTGNIGFYVYSLLDGTQLMFINGRTNGGAQKQYSSNGSFDGTGLFLYDRNAETNTYDDKLLIAGENGLFYTVSLNTEFDHVSQNKSLKITPETQYLRSKTRDQEDTTVNIEASIAMYDHYAYMADAYGIIKCVDVNTMRVVWCKDCGDNTDATIALDFDEDGKLWLYTGNTHVKRLKKKTPVTIRRLNAMTGEEDWTYQIDCVANNDALSGCKASPVVGEHAISDLVIFTVNMTGSGKGSTVVALSKKTGEVKWTCELNANAISSPVAVYNDVGNAWIIQGDENGVLHLLDGERGTEYSSLDLGAPIESSPAVYKDMLVVGTGGTTTNGNKANGKMYGIKLK
ncbi:MAG: hypothetical protein CW338_01985 [Clostridiales bacterium]|nr:hypothetical protein [Clostridiales bacterium]